MEVFLQNGTLLRGNYRIIRTIGSGGFGCTYEAEHAVFGERVAIKEFFYKDFCERATDGTITCTLGRKDTVKRLLRKFIDEAKALHTLKKKHIEL